MTKLDKAVVGVIRAATASRPSPQGPTTQEIARVLGEREGVVLQSLERLQASGVLAAPASVTILYSEGVEIARLP